MRTNADETNAGVEADADAAALVLRTYSDYRVFLRDWYESRKALRPGFSYRRFSALLGLKSPNFMQLVISGQRGVSNEIAERLAKLIGLKAAERAYFLALVEREQASDESSLARAEKAMLIARRKLVTSHLEQVKEIVMTEWYHMLVRELVFLPSFKPTGVYISKTLNGLISEEEAARSLKLLVEAGCLTKDEKQRWQAKEIALDSGDYVFNRGVMEKHHGDTLKVWGKNLSRLNPAEQELGLIHIPIASEKIPELRERIQKFQDEIIGWLCEEKNPDRVVQLGTYLIPFDKVQASVKKLK